MATRFNPPMLQISKEASLQATQWLVQLQEEEPGSSDWKTFQQWHDANPANAAAWAQVNRFTQQLRSTHPSLLSQALQTQSDKDAAQSRQTKRRQAIKLLTLAAIGTPALWGLTQRTGQWDRWTADYSTARGQQLPITLADGSQVLLNTASALNVRYTEHHRALHLKSGEILVTTAQSLQKGERTAPPDSRPLQVYTPHGILQALGTRFTVRTHETHTHVGVLEGAVQAQTLLQTSHHIVQAGQQLRITDGALGIEKAYGAADAAWINGSLIAHDMALPVFIRQLARYRVGRLACDESAAHLRVSGIYSIHDTDKVLQLLARNLPLQIKRRTDYWVTVGLRDA